MSRIINSTTGSYVAATIITLWSTAMVFAATTVPSLA